MREYAPTARPYELMTIFTPEVGDDAVTDQLEVIAGYVRTAGGAVYQVLSDAPWGRRRFAYPIRHDGRDVRDGFYSVMHFDLVPSQVFEVERDLKLDERVLRFLLTLHEVKATPTTEGTDESDSADRVPAPRTEIAPGDLVRNAEAARAAQDAARAAQDAARAAQEAARPAQPRDSRPDRQDRPRPAAPPAPDTAATETPVSAAPADEATAEAPETAPAAPTTPTTPEPAETESAPNVTPVAPAAPVVEPGSAAEPAAPTDQAPAGPEPAPGDGDEPSRTQDQ